MSVKLQPPTWGFICTQGFLVTIYSPNKPSLCSLPSGKQAELARNPTENFLILLEKLKLSLGAGIVLLFFIQSACVKSLWPGPCYIYVFTLWMFRCCCPGEVVESASLEVFKVRLDLHLGDAGLWLRGYRGIRWLA